MPDTRQVTTNVDVNLTAADTLTLAAGANIVGKVGVDQTIPGTTDSVTAKQGTASATEKWLTDRKNVSSVGTITALNGVVTLALQGMNGVGANLTGTWTATVKFLESHDNGVTFDSIPAFSLTDNANLESFTTTNRQIGIFPTPGATHVQAKATAFTSGTINVDLYATTLKSNFLPAIVRDGNVNGNVWALAFAGRDASSGSPQIIRTATANPGVSDIGVITRNIPSGTQIVDSELPAASALADATANPTTPLAGAALEFFNGTTWDRARGDTANGLDADVTRLPALVAGTARIGGAYGVSGQIIDENGTVLTVKRAFANVAASTTDGSIVAAVATKKLRILWSREQAGATATNLTYNSKPAGAGTAISSLHANPANGGSELPMNVYGHYETVAGEGLTVTTGAGSTTGVEVGYVEV